MELGSDLEMIKLVDVSTTELVLYMGIGRRLILKNLKMMMVMILEDFARNVGWMLDQGEGYNIRLKVGSPSFNSSLNIKELLDWI